MQSFRKWCALNEMEMPGEVDEESTGEDLTPEEGEVGNFHTALRGIIVRHLNLLTQDFEKLQDGALRYKQKLYIASKILAALKFSPSQLLRAITAVKSANAKQGRNDQILQAEEPPAASPVDPASGV